MAVLMAEPRRRRASMPNLFVPTEVHSVVRPASRSRNITVDKGSAVKLPTTLHLPLGSVQAAANLSTSVNSSARRSPTVSARKDAPMPSPQPSTRASSKGRSSSSNSSLVQAMQPPVVQDADFFARHEKEKAQADKALVAAMDGTSTQNLSEAISLARGRGVDKKKLAMADDVLRRLRAAEIRKQLHETAADRASGRQVVWKSVQLSTNKVKVADPFTKLQSKAILEGMKEGWTCPDGASSEPKVMDRTRRKSIGSTAELMQFYKALP